MKQNWELVVARYKEDTSWTKSIIDFGIKVSIYNKHEGENLLPNVGREAHTYLTHIVKNYDNLKEYTAFLQGDPIPHCSDFFERLSYLLENQFDFASLSQGIIMCDPNGRPGCGGSGIVHMPVGKHYEWVTKRKSPQVFISPPGAQFVVSKSTILRNSKEIYERCLSTLEHDNNPIEAHCLERSWASIFGYVSNLKIENLLYQNDHELDLENYLKNHLVDEKITLSGKLGPYFFE